MAEHGQYPASSMHEEMDNQFAELSALHHNPWKDLTPSERSMNDDQTQNPDSDHKLFSCSVPPPIFAKLDDIDADAFNENMYTFFCKWIPETIQIYGPIGSSICTREFWSSQILTELDHRLWQKEFLGREPTEEELNWLVDNAMRIYWPRIEEVLHERANEICQKYMRPESDEQAMAEAGRHEKKMKLRRTMEVEDMLSHMSISDQPDEEGWQKRLKIHSMLKNGYGWEDLECETTETTGYGRKQNGIEQKRTEMAWARYRERCMAGEGPDRESERGPCTARKARTKWSKHLLLGTMLGFI